MDGFMGVSALTIGGSIFMLIRSLPLGDWYTNFLTSTGLVDILNFPVMITSDLISLYLVIALGYFTAKSFGKNPFSGAMISLGALLLLTPFETAAVLTLSLIHIFSTFTIIMDVIKISQRALFTINIWINDIFSMYYYDTHNE